MIIEKVEVQREAINGNKLHLIVSPNLLMNGLSIARLYKAKGATVLTLQKDIPNLKNLHAESL